MFHGRDAGEFGHRKSLLISSNLFAIFNDFQASFCGGYRVSHQGITRAILRRVRRRGLQASALDQPWWLRRLSFHVLTDRPDGTQTFIQTLGRGVCRDLLKG